MKDYYKILQVAPDASTEVIQMAYKALAKKYHPDLNPGQEEAAQEKMKDVNEAYEISLIFPKPLRFSFYDVSYRSVPAHLALRYTQRQVLWYRHQDCSFVRLSRQLERYTTNACQNNRRHTDIERAEYHR